VTNSELPVDLHVSVSFALGTLGAFRQFAWQAGGPNVGVIADIAERSGVHAHWLFVFEVAALEPAVAITRAAGDIVLDPVLLPGGGRLFVCDDPQGAAFALRERGPITPPW